jgi:hypothetical protein
MRCWTGKHLIYMLIFTVPAVLLHLFFFFIHKLKKYTFFGNEDSALFKEIQQKRPDDLE